MWDLLRRQKVLVVDSCHPLRMKINRLAMLEVEPRSQNPCYGKVTRRSRDADFRISAFSIIINGSLALFSVYIDFHMSQIPLTNSK